AHPRQVDVHEDDVWRFGWNLFERLLRVSITAAANKPFGFCNLGRQILANPVIIFHYGNLYRHDGVWLRHSLHEPRRLTRFFSTLIKPEQPLHTLTTSGLFCNPHEHV